MRVDDLTPEQAKAVADLIGQKKWVDFLPSGRVRIMVREGGMLKNIDVQPEQLIDTANRLKGTGKC